jgi:heme/copper-type cytochrome/quinol oxidase subunit 1
VALAFPTLIFLLKSGRRQNHQAKPHAIREIIMRLTPTLLFATTTLLILLLGILTYSKSFDIQLHDTYFIIGYFPLAVTISFFTGLTAFAYFGFERMKRPIRLKTGFLHFGLFVAGLLLLLVSLNLPTSTDFYETMLYSTTIIPFLGVVLLLSSILVFIYGLAKAIFKK